MNPQGGKFDRNLAIFYKQNEREKYDLGRPNRFVYALQKKVIVKNI